MRVFRAKISDFWGRVMWVIGNFKQNPASEAQALALAKAARACGDALVALAPSYVHLSAVAKALQGSSVRLCAQDVGGLSAEVGAYTGDVGAAQLADIGVSMTLIGHSERRKYHGDDNTVLAKKLTNAKEAKLTAVFCVGECADDNAAGNTLSVLDDQLAPLMLEGGTQGVMVAYEPVWAIGSGVSATLEEIELAHRHIKSRLPGTTVLYGGSVNTDNVAHLAKSALIDGFLVGGASLAANSFATIVQACR